VPHQQLPRDARSHRRPSGWTDLPAPGTTPWWSIPEPPESVQAAGQGAQDRWAALWTFPEASQWDPQGDADLVARVAVLRALVAEVGADAAAKKFSELRQCEDRLGLSPTARQRLHWRIPENDPMDADLDVIPLTADLMEF